MKQKITNLVVVMMSISTTFFAQTNSLWKKTIPEKMNGSEVIQRPNNPTKADYYQMDLVAFKNLLANAPVFGNFMPPSNLIIEFPLADGSFQKFSVFEWSIMEKGLEEKFPMIKSYAAQGIDDPTATMRFSVTQFGLHTMTLSGNTATCYIDPYTKDANYYIVYNKLAMGADTRNFECTTDEHLYLPSAETERAGPNNSPLNANDQKLRTYRLAQSCNAEYGNIFAGTSNQVANIQAQMAITMTRVNGVYERDLSIHMNFVANNNLIIYYGSTTADPWSNEFNTKTAQTIDAAIGIANYDIGHNFNTSGGGNAGCLSCVCAGTTATQGGTHKGRGYTGSPNPTGDPFDIDYVAHEMGHQFGGYHVMNNCSRSGNGTTEVEPGSGSSIMGYAGICAANQNVVPNSHDDFNYVNVRDIMNNVKTGASTCGVVTTLTNNPPTANAGADYIIPKSTAYILEGTATDADGMGSLTYSWSQNNPTQSPGNAAPLSTYTVGPMYRALPPSTSPNRYMPVLTSVLAGNLTPTWEVTPSVGRTMNFSFLVRDNDAAGGQTASDLMTVTVNGASGPFVITSQNTASSWNAGATETITWNVAGTNVAPVSCANVDIFLSTDGGYTYPITIAAGVPNTGSAVINVPQVTTTTGRIMVRGAGNIFYDLNGGTISIQAAEFTMTPASTTQNNCPPNNQTFSFTYDTYLSFNDVTTFSASGNPAGTTVTFNPTTAVTDNTPVAVTISGLTPAMAGTYNLIVTGTSLSVTKTSAITLNVLNATLNAPTLSSPADAATGINSTSTLTWASAGAAGITYDIEVASDPSFTTIVSSAIGLTTTSYTVTGLASSTTYFWRVSAQNSCTTSSNSSEFSFTTSSCLSNTSANVPVAISTGAPATVTSTLMVTAAGTITDVNVVNVQGTHTWINDLTIAVKSPANTTVNLFNQICYNEDNFSVSFDDASALTTLPCPPVDGLTYKPVGLLSGFNGQSAAGTWTLSVIDGANQDGGSLTNWALELCVNSSVGIKENIFLSPSRLYPNPTTGLLNVQLGGEANEQLKIKIVNTLGQVVDTKTASGTTLISFDLNAYANGMYHLIIEGKNAQQHEKVIISR